ncbi:unnamed protein product, partial [Polarella glacialis]
VSDLQPIFMSEYNRSEDKPEMCCYAWLYDQARRFVEKRRREAQRDAQVKAEQDKGKQISASPAALKQAKEVKKAKAEATAATQLAAAAAVAQQAAAAAVKGLGKGKANSAAPQACFKFQKGTCPLAASACKCAHVIDPSAAEREAQALAKRTETEKGKGKSKGGGKDGGKPCWFHASKSGCSRGTSCSFSHAAVLGAVTLMGAIGSSNGLSLPIAALPVGVDVSNKYPWTSFCNNNSSMPWTTTTPNNNIPQALQAVDYADALTVYVGDTGRCCCSR